YDQLICGDIAEFLETQSHAFDLAVAADVFVYIGDLSRVFRGVRGALRDGGLFGFSVESTDEADFVLRTTLRYAHSVPYLEKLARDHRFVLERVEARVIRQEHEVDVNGYLAVMRCA
ncbi:MAG TPA: methyltransferase domain-containing protein, partial [Xanthobacteraceae bacterium]|nr:methyltransferase domain-containing protein [Xanthobacteraceae bacterium]